MSCEPLTLVWQYGGHSPWHVLAETHQAADAKDDEMRKRRGEMKRRRKEERNEKRRKRRKRKERESLNGKEGKRRACVETFTTEGTRREELGV